jgi:hypothetical protein
MNEYNKELTNRMLVVDKVLQELNQRIREVNKEKIRLKSAIENVYDEERGMRLFKIIQRDKKLEEKLMRLNDKKKNLDMEILKIQKSTRPNFAFLEQFVAEAEDLLKKQRQVVEDIESGILETKKILSQ